MTSGRYSSEEMLNVFVDAGVNSTNFESTMSASGVMVYYQDKLIHSSVTILKRSTNNIGELLALFIGVNVAINIKRSINNEKGKDVINRINIYSDSSYSVDCITKWFSGWLKNGRSSKTGFLFTTSGGRLKNQELIEAIIRTVTSSNESVNFVRVRGHQDPNNYESIVSTMNYIEKANTYYIEQLNCEECECYVDEETTKSIIERNNLVDQLAGSMYPNTIEEYNLLPTIRDLFPMSLYNITPKEYRRFEELIHFQEYK